jgi:hypothetical protein
MLYRQLPQSRSGDLSLGTLLTSTMYAGNKRRFAPLLEALGLGIDARAAPEESRHKHVNGRLIPMDHVLKSVFK